MQWHDCAVVEPPRNCWVWVTYNEDKSDKRIATTCDERACGSCDLTCLFGALYWADVTDADLEEVERSKKEGMAVAPMVYLKPVKRGV